MFIYKLVQELHEYSAALKRKEKQIVTFIINFVLDSHFLVSARFGIHTWSFKDIILFGTPNTFLKIKERKSETNSSICSDTAHVYSLP